MKQTKTSSNESSYPWQSRHAPATFNVLLLRKNARALALPLFTKRVSQKEVLVFTEGVQLYIIAILHKPGNTSPSFKMSCEDNIEAEIPNVDAMDRMPEIGFDFDKVQACVLYDAERQPITFGELLESDYSATIFIFLRHFLDYVTRDYVEDFSKIFKHELERNSCRVVMIGCSPSKFIKQFVEQTSCPHLVYCDSTREIYKSLGLHSRTTDLPQTSSPHVKTNSFIGFWQTVWRSVTTIQQGDPFQMGGQLIVSKDKSILFFHRDTHPYDHTPINDLLRVVGLPRIDFKTKYRIKHV